MGYYLTTYSNMYFANIMREKMNVGGAKKLINFSFKILFCNVHIFVNEKQCRIFDYSGLVTARILLYRKKGHYRFI